MSANQGRGSHWIRDTKRLRIYARDGFRCVWCGCQVARARDLGAPGVRLATLDHVVPRPRGSNDASNLITACEACNSARAGMSALDYASHRATSDFGRVRWFDVAITLDRVIEAMGAALPERNLCTTLPKKKSSTAFTPEAI